MRRSSSITVILLLGSAASSSVAGQMPWKTTDWAVVCTRELEALLVSTAAERAAYIDGVLEEYSEMARSYASPEAARAAAMAWLESELRKAWQCHADEADGVRRIAENQLERSSEWLKSLGFGGPAIHPLPTSGPVDWLDPARAFLCEVSYCAGLALLPRAHGVYRPEDLYLYLGLKWPDALTPHSALTAAVADVGYAPTHELFHAIQFGYDNAISPETAWRWKWLLEGSAKLVQLVAGERWGTLLAPNPRTRYYSDPLHVPPTLDAGPRLEDWAYGTWYFWDYLGERLSSPDRISYLDVLFRQDLGDGNGVAGVETGLIELGTQGLYDLYPAFVADRLDEPCFFEELGEFDRWQPGAPCVRRMSSPWWTDLSPGDSARIRLRTAPLATQAIVVRTDVPVGGVGLLRVWIPASEDDQAYHLVVGSRRMDVEIPPTARFPFGARNLYLGSVSGGRDSVLVRIAHVPKDIASIEGGVGNTFGEVDIPVHVRLELTQGVVTYSGSINGSYAVRNRPAPTLSVFTGEGPHPEACTVVMSLPSEDASDLVMTGGILPSPLATGRFPIMDVRDSAPRDPGIMSVEAMPSCGLPGVDCSVGLPREMSRGGTFEIIRLNEDIVEGRFSAPVGSRAYGEAHSVVEGHFVARLTNLVGGRLPPDHPCLPRDSGR